MKKSLIALAVAGAMTAPMVAQADATLYGKFEMRIKSEDNKDLEVESDDFRIGIKGDADLGMDGVKGVYGYEMELNPDDTETTDTAAAETVSQEVTIRKAFVGATGGFGTALIGRIDNPAEAVVSKIGNQSESLKEDLTPDRLGSAVAYVSPSMNGFNAYVAAVAEGQGDDAEEDVDGYVLGGNYNAGDLSVSAGFWEFDRVYTDTTEDQQWFGISGEYAFGATKVALGYQDLERGTDNDETDVVSLKVTHKMDNLTLWADYDHFDNGTAVSTTAQYDNEWGLGVIYKLGTQGSIDVEYIDLNGDVATTADNEIFSVGYTIKF